MTILSIAILIFLQYHISVKFVEKGNTHVH